MDLLLLQKRVIEFGKLTQYPMSNAGISLLVFAYLHGYAKVDPQKSASKFY